MRFISCIAACAFATASHSATVSVGSFDIDAILFADDVTVTVGNVPTAARVIGTNFAESVGVADGETIEVLFTDNTLVNGTGFDLFLFETGNPEAPSVSVTTNGQVLQAQFIERDVTRVLTPEAINIWGIDFDDFGLPQGLLNGSIFLRGVTTNTPEIQAVAAVNGGPVAPVPLPASIGFLAVACGFGWAVKKRKPA